VDSQAVQKTAQIQQKLQQISQIQEIVALDVKAPQRYFQTEDIVVLDVKIDSPEEFSFVQDILMQEGKNVVWVLEGSLVESSNPDGSKIAGLV